MIEVTRENVVEAIENGATSMAAIGKALGFKSTGGSTSKRIKAACPEVANLLNGNVPAGGATEETPKPVKVTKPESKPEPKPVIVGNPYDQTDAPRSLYAELYDISSDQEKTLDEILDEAEAKTGKNRETLRAFIRVMTNPNDRHNSRGMGNVAKTEGKIRFGIVG